MLAGMQRTGRGMMLVVVLQGGAVACSDPDESPEPTETGQCFNYSGWDGNAPAVSLRNRLLNDGEGTTAGIFRRACNANACHGKPTGGAGRLYLGPAIQDSVTQQPVAIQPADITAVLANLNNVPSGTNGSVLRVKPSDPQNSFLMMKLDGCFEGISAGCQPLTGAKTSNPCGDRMPQGAELAATERDEVRRWIAQGALDG
jgi:hypothetical protein